VTPLPLHEAEMPLDAHPRWREATWWWAWSDDDRLASGRWVRHRHGAVTHTVDALVSPTGVVVDHRSSGPDVGPGAGTPTLPYRDAPGAPTTTARRRRTDGGVLTYDLLLAAAPVVGSGPVLLWDRPSEIDGWAGMALTAAGVDVLDLAPGPGERPLERLPHRFELLLLLPGPAGVSIGIVEHDASGRSLVGEVHHPGGGPAGSLALDSVEWEPGIRRVRSVDLSDDRGSLRLRTRCVLPGSLVGGLGGVWPLGGWVGDAGRRWVRAPRGARLDGLAGVQHEHLCAVEGRAGTTRAILSLTALGDHARSRLSGWTDPA
jgi:hypothetical protein